MNWDKKALLEAWDLADSEFYAREPEQIFTDGAQWQRNQLRTNETVTRLADFLHNDDVGETLNEHEKSCRRPDCNERDLYAEYALAAINALLGEH